MGEKALRFGEHPDADVLGYGEETLVIFAGEGNPPYQLQKGTVTLYRIPRG